MTAQPSFSDSTAPAPNPLTIVAANPAAALASAEAEKRALGAMLAQPGCIGANRSLLPDEADFTVAHCRAAFRGLLSLADAGLTFSYRALAAHLYHHDERAAKALLYGHTPATEADALAVMEGVFADLIKHGAFDQADLPTHLNLVRTLATKREAVSLARDLDAAARDKSLDDDTLAARFSTAAIRIVSRSPRLQASTAQRGMDALDARQDALQLGLDADTCISTGIRLVDEAIGGGMVPGLTTLAAYTNNGKTSLAYNAVLTNARIGKAVALCSTENDEDTVWRELLAVEAGVPSEAIRTGAFKRANPSAYYKAMRSLSAMKIYVHHYDDPDGMPFHVLQTAAHTARLAFERLDLLVLDWMQDMAVPGITSRTREADKIPTAKLLHIVPRLKDFAKSENIALLGTVQLTRESLTGGLRIEYIAGSAEIARRSEAVIMCGLAAFHDKTAQDPNTLLVAIGKKRGTGSYAYYTDHFRLDPVTRRITTRMREPVHADQFRQIVDDDVEF